ncbi:MAG: G5 domain-containing protein [Bacilli bacterium]|nr:G5 domain-containing protein [Bacilli bacterium]
MKKAILICMILLSISICFSIKAEECCENQGGLSGNYNAEGYAICKDETPTYNELCKKPGTPNKPNTGSNTLKKGCTNTNAKNYDATAKVDDGSCFYYIYGCTDKESVNYNSMAEKDDGTCKQKILGCMNKEANNYKIEANMEDGSCLFTTTLIEEKNLYYTTQYREDENILDSEEKIITKGVMGFSKIEYRIMKDSNGKEVFRQKIREDVVKPSQPEIVALGTSNTLKSITKILYLINLPFMLLLYLYVRYIYDSSYYLLKGIYDFSFTPRVLSEFFYIASKVLLYFLYYITVLPIYIDLLTLLRNKIDKNFA